MSFPFVCCVALDHNMIFKGTILACETPYTPKNARNRSKILTGSLSLRFPYPSSRVMYLIRKLTITLPLSSCFHGLQTVNRPEHGRSPHVRGSKEVQQGWGALLSHPIQLDHQDTNCSCVLFCLQRERIRQHYPRLGRTTECMIAIHEGSLDYFLGSRLI